MRIELHYALNHKLLKKSKCLNVDFYILKYSFFSIIQKPFF